MSGDPGTGLWGAAEAYERYMGRWSRKVAPLFLDWLAAPDGLRWADIGCGTGELSLQIATRCRPSRLIGIDPAAGFLAQAARRIPGAEFRAGDATRLDLPDNGLDYAVSGLVLNFLPDPAQALGEMARVVRPGGTVALYVWDYAGQMQIMRQFFDTARLVDPGAAAHDDGIRAPICRPGPLRAAFLAAGLTEAATTALDIPAAFADFADYWEPFLGGTGSAPKYCAGLDEDRRNRICNLLRQRLPTGPDGEILLAVRAWGVKGRVPG
ncbi:methyltransferase [Siccirubricoccus deserti]|uniref:Methyltransferase domain-containing protein n=1 Tax=Siccirubricoccus deserti TaxID=2013562 RepID=A0A9X0UBD3_9PROT|nr:class I SAM-dependent methyltransferase [Siccirubricoccus deserti]MBC4013842.1 methyltransferase domain-containing protein [Siccirubricoccus deserti]GGC29925.1 methyltransferase [Siccirubricoccus deserti]